MDGKACLVVITGGLVGKQSSIGDSGVFQDKFRRKYRHRAARLIVPIPRTFNFYSSLPHLLYCSCRDFFFQVVKSANAQIIVAE